MPICHAEIVPFKAYVKETFLYNMDPSKTGVVECIVYGVSAYPGFTLSFDIWIKETGGTFAFIPFHAIRATEEAPSVEYDLSDLICRNSPDPEIAITSFSFLKSKPCFVYLKQRDIWIKACYLFSVDWYKENELFNVLRLENGQFAALPNHRLLFGKQLEWLPDYRKLTAEWRV